MTKRQAIPFFFLLKSLDSDQRLTYDEFERWFYKFKSCKVPHLNLNREATKNLLDFIRQFDLKEFTEQEILDLEASIT